MDETTGPICATADTADTGIAGPARGPIPVRCPKCRDTNVGTEEELIGTALVSGFDPQTGEFEYTGETIVYYDGSVTQISDDGRTIMFCRDCCTHFLFEGRVDRVARAGENQTEQPCKPGDT